MLRVIGGRIKLARDRAGLSQSELATILAVHSMVISKWERGVNIPSAESLDALATALNVSVDYLLGRTEDARGVIDEADLPPDERRILALVRRRDISALLKMIIELEELRAQGEIAGVDEAALDQDSGGGGE